MHFPIRGPAEVRVKELREVKEASDDQKLSHVRASGASEFLTTRH
jgi:hypothetical protein